MIIHVIPKLFSFFLCSTKGATLVIVWSKMEWKRMLSVPNISFCVPRNKESQLGMTQGWVNGRILMFCLNYPFKQAFFPPLAYRTRYERLHTQAHLEMCEFTYSPRGLEFSQESMSLHCIKLPSEYIGAKRWGKATRTTSIWLAPAEKWGCWGLLWYWICQG